MEEYDKAIEKADIGIKIALKSERGDKLDTLVYEKGWSNLKSTDSDKQYNKNDLKICVQAFFISDLYKREKNKNDIQKFINKYEAEVDLQ